MAGRKENVTKVVKRFQKWGETVKYELETQLKEIDLHLAEAEKAIKSGDTASAETEVFTGREKLRNAQTTAERISN